MPEEYIRTLRCDVPGCEKVGDYYRIEVDGETYRVILDDEHAKVLRELALLGEPEKRKRPAKRADRRGTDSKRLDTLLDADLAD